MSKKATNNSTKRAAKRNARSKAVAKSANRNKQTTSGKAEKLIRKIRKQNPGIGDFDSVLDQAVRDINKGKKTSEVKFTTPDELISGVKQAVSEVFKLYAYVTVVDMLIKHGQLEHELEVNLNDVSLALISLDKRVNALESIKDDEVAINTEALEIGTDLSSFADAFHDELTRAEKHAEIIEGKINQLVEEVTDEEEPTPVGKRRLVLESVAYAYLNEVIKKEVETASNDPESEAATEASVDSQE